MFQINAVNSGKEDNVYEEKMTMNIVTVTVILALLVTVGALVWGLGSMAHGGAYDREHSEQLMFTRIGLQAVAFIFVMLALAFSFF